MNDTAAEFFETLPQRCLRLWRGEWEALEEVAQAARDLGFEAEWKDGRLQVRGAVGTAIELGCDPLTAFVLIAFGFVGARWAAAPAVCKLFDETKRLWKQAAKG